MPLAEYFSDSGTTYGKFGFSIDSRFYQYSDSVILQLAKNSGRVGKLSLGTSTGAYTTIMPNEGSNGLVTIQLPTTSGFLGTMSFDETTQTLNISL